MYQYQWWQDFKIVINPYDFNNRLLSDAWGKTVPLSQIDSEEFRKAKLGGYKLVPRVHFNWAVHPIPPVFGDEASPNDIENFANWTSQ